MSNVKFSTWCGSLRIQQKSTLGDGMTTLDVRRVHPNGKDEHIQVAVTVERFHPKRTVSQHGYIELSPQEVQFLITALTKTHPKPDDTYRPHHSHEAEERAFYGLPEKEAA